MYKKQKGGIGGSIKDKFIHANAEDMKFFNNSIKNNLNTKNRLIVYFFYGSGGEYTNNYNIGLKKEAFSTSLRRLRRLFSKYLPFKLFFVSKFSNIFSNTLGVISSTIFSRITRCTQPSIIDYLFFSNSVEILKKQLDNNYTIILIGFSYGGFVVNKLSEYDYGSNSNNLYIRTINSIYISKNPTINLKNIFHVYHKNDVAYNRITKYCLKSTDLIFKRIIFYGESQKKTFTEKKAILGTNEQWEKHVEESEPIFNI